MVIGSETLLAVVVLLCAFFFTLGRWYDAAKKSEAQSQVAFYASLWAATESRSLHKSPVIQRIIDRTHLLKPKEGDADDRVREMNEELEDSLEGIKVERKRREQGMSEIDVEDLV
jgi:hypothetical protein